MSNRKLNRKERVRETRSGLIDIARMDHRMVDEDIGRSRDGYHPCILIRGQPAVVHRPTLPPAASNQPTFSRGCRSGSATPPGKQQYPASSMRRGTIVDARPGVDERGIRTAGGDSPLRGHEASGYPLSAPRWPMNARPRASGPIDMRGFEVDHVIPESLLDEPERLAKVLNDLGRPDTFNVNSFENWLPACGPCNNSKSSYPWDPSPLIQRRLQDAARRAPKARAMAESTIQKAQLTKALNTL
jgi:hypothetical protein